MPHEKTRGDVFIAIRSRDLISTAQQDYNNSGRFNLFENIIAGDDEVLGVSLISATIPNSFFNLSNNNQNNIIKFKETGDTDFITLTIPSGSYDILELSSVIKTLLENNSTNSLTYTFTYNEINLLEFCFPFLNHTDISYKTLQNTLFFKKVYLSP